MKCPHCNKEHEEGTPFCPYTGKEIQPQLQSCPNPDCENYGKNALPIDYLYCPKCSTRLVNVPKEPHQIVSTMRPQPEKRYKVVLLSADDRLLPEIDRIAGTNIADNAFWKSLFPRRGNSYLPHELYEERIVESKAIPLKKQLEAIGAEVKLERLNSSTVEDFRKGHIFVNDVALGKTSLRELLTDEYRKEYHENIDNWMAEDLVSLSFEPSENVNTEVFFLNPALNSDTIAEMKTDYEQRFVNPSEANFSFAENIRQVVNWMEMEIEKLPCFAEMGIDEKLLLNDDHSEEYIENNINNILAANGWERIPNFLKSDNMFSEGVPKATFRCVDGADTDNDVYMLFFDRYKDSSWSRYSVVFAINLIK